MYEHEIAYAVGLIDRFWLKSFPGRRSRYAPPGRIIAYYPASGTPRCDGTPERSGSADYCGSDDFLAFDEPGFVIPFYRRVGPVAAATILAHEWGHVVQTRLGLEFPETVEKELNADCLAGAWLGHASTRGLVSKTEVTEARIQLLDVGDNPDIPWQAPDAHGSGPDRVQALMVGYEGGPGTCLRKLRPGFSRGHPGRVP